MLESIVTVLVSALMASLSFMVVKWLNSVDDQLHNLEKAYRKIKEEIADVRNQTVRTSEFLKVIHKFEQADQARLNSINRIDTDLRALTAQVRGLASKIDHLPATNKFKRLE